MSARELIESKIAADPFEQFRRWYEAAVAAHVLQPDAFTLATATPAGKPSARLVLLKRFDSNGFVFFTNYESRKGQELAANPWAALTFFWPQLERQVRIEGSVELVTSALSDAYFQSRPFESRLSAAVSPQSQIIPGRELLERRVRELRIAVKDGNVPRPANWGGYRLMPVAVEFWQGRPNRLHDRLVYTIQDNASWKIERLAP